MLFGFKKKMPSVTVFSRLKVSVHYQIQLPIFIFKIRTFWELRLQKVKSCVRNREDKFEKYLEIDPTVCFQDDLQK